MCVCLTDFREGCLIARPPPPPSLSSPEKAHLNRVKEITKIERYQSLKKDFLHDHINKINVDKKTINKINRNKITYKVNIESLDEKDQKFSIPANASPLTSVVTPVNEKHPKLISLC